MMTPLTGSASTKVMDRSNAIVLLNLLVCVTSCSSRSEPVKMDFTTPQGAILMLEDAYRSGDIEAAVAAKSFRYEAKLMLRDTMPSLKDDDEIIDNTAEVLELAYRKEIETSGFPDFQEIKSSFTSVEPYADHVVVVTEKCLFPDGGHSIQRILVSETDNGWRVLYPLD